MRILAAAMVLSFALAGAATAQTKSYAAKLDAASEVPPNASTGKGEAMLTLDAKTLSWTVTYDGLTGPVGAAHIHGPAPAGANAPPVVPMTAAASPLKGEAALTDAQIADLDAGRLYINLHTAANRGGEIRGQITPKP